MEQTFHFGEGHAARTPHQQAEMLALCSGHVCALQFSLGMKGGDGESKQLRANVHEATGEDGMIRQRWTLERHDEEQPPRELAAEPCQMCALLIHRTAMRCG